MRRRNVKPALPARAAAWGVSFLLTLTLTVTILLGPPAANRILTSEDLHIRTATENDVILKQMNRVTETIRELAADYSFHADEVISLLTRTQFLELNEKCARWWTRIVREGMMEDIPVWNAGEDITDAIAGSLDPNVYEDEADRTETAVGIANTIEKTVNRTVMPFRKALVRLAVRYVSRKADIPGIIRFVSLLPLASLAFSLLLAGLIALLCAKRIRWSLKYYGAAFAGAGISTAAGILLALRVDVSGMLQAASEGLNRQAEGMLRVSYVEIWALTAVFIIMGFACLAVYIREPARHKKRGGYYEAEKNSSPDPIPEDTGTSPVRRRRRFAQRPV